MIRYTTPTLILEVEKDLTDVDVYVSLEQPRGKQFDPIKIPSSAKELNDEGNTLLYLTFTQEMTGSLKVGSQLKIQINWINSLGVREATDTRSISVTDNLLEEVISYGND